MSATILGVRRFQLQGSVFLCVHGFADGQPVSAEGQLCRVAELPSLSQEAEDALVLELSERLGKRPWWRSVLATLKDTLKPTKGNPI